MPNTAFTSSAISSYNIVGGIDLRSGAPVALDGSIAGLTIGSANVTAGVFNGSTSWVSLAGLTLSGVAAITAKLNIANPTGGMLWEYSVDSSANSGFYGYGLSNLQLRLNANGAGPTQFSDMNCDLSGGQLVLINQWEIDNPYRLQLAINAGSTVDSTLTSTTGSFGAATLYVGARASSSLFLTGTISFVVVHNAFQDATQETNLTTALANPDSLLAGSVIKGRGRAVL